MPERHRPLWIARIVASASVAIEPASTRLAGCVSDVDRWLCELLAGAQVAPGYDALVAATFGASIPFSVRTSFNSGRERVRKGRSGERGNPNQLRHLRLHSDSVWDSGEAQGQVLDDFTSVWDVLTPENRGRLLRAVVQSVEVDEPANQVKVVLADLGAGISRAGEPALQEATA